AEDDRVRRRRRDRLEGRAVLRRQDQGVRREGGVTALRLDILKALNEERSARRSVIVITQQESGEQRLVKGAGIRNDPLKDLLGKHLRTAKSGIEETPEGRVFLTVHVPSPKLVITGAVHISQTLAPMGQLLGYDVTIVDPRTAFASIERFPDVKV